jgi:transcriptional regulator with XRE-family HTH domain
VAVSGISPAVHRTIVCVDVEGFGDRERTNPHQAEVRKGLYRALERAFVHTGVAWQDYKPGDRGDGVLILVPPQVPKCVLVTDVLPELAAALRDHNQGRDVRSQIRLRVALHAGEVIYDSYGTTSAAVNLTYRLLDAQPLKQALAASSQALAVIASAWFFDEVIRHTPAGSPEVYERVHVTVKETNAHAWMRLLSDRATTVQESNGHSPLVKYPLGPPADRHLAPGQAAEGIGAGLPLPAGRQVAHAGPLRARMLLGDRLWRLRTAHAITREGAAAAIGKSAAMLSLWEQAEAGAELDAVDALLTVYGVVEGQARFEILTLAAHANTPGWVQSYHGVLSRLDMPQVELEQEARLIRSYCAQVLPPLLQTADYAAALARSSRAATSTMLVDRRVELVLRRQRLLAEPDPPQLWVFLNESALQHTVGSIEVTRQQFRHLIAMAERPHITIQVVPKTTQVATGGPFAIYRSPERELSDVVCLEQLTGTIYLIRKNDLYHYQEVMHRLSVRAAPPEASVAILRRLLTQL